MNLHYSRISHPTQSTQVMMQRANEIVRNGGNLHDVANDNGLSLTTARRLWMGFAEYNIDSTGRRWAIIRSGASCDI